ncbi:MAG: Asp-tRNA(Asn)/Glu-tRNA(Gln) amidotransferase subunit GatA [Flavobacterium sp.]|nr:Asp-tRNA(Asn)/Glu-tRNA(Gln) amidotransferase subunit GatA [Pedobacter sp.]
MSYKSLAAIKTDLGSGVITLPKLVAQYLETIEKHKHLNAFLEVYTEEVKEHALKVEGKINNGNAGKLAGMVIGLKDNICYKGHQVSASSKILENFTSVYSSTVVERLLEEDAIIIGRLNCDEFAMGASNENSAFGPVLNFADSSRVSGGSSGGAAVAVQSGMCLVSLGSDTGGSVRQPASFCGLYGFKPTYGTISRWGLIAYASSFDIIGPITNCVADMQLVMEVIAGADEFDATALAKPVEEYTKTSLKKKTYKFAYIKETLETAGVEPEVKEATENYIASLRDKGHQVEAISFDLLPYMIPVYYVLTAAEASSNLARFAGMHYGYRSKQVKDLETTIRNSRTEGFGEEVKRRIMLGVFVLSAGSYEAYYSKAQKVRRLVQDKTFALFEDFDFIISPTSPTTAFKIGEKSDNPLAMYLADIFTVHANIAGNPAISIPNGLAKNGMPIGVQIMGRHFEDAALLALAKSLS